MATASVPWRRLGSLAWRRSSRSRISSGGRQRGKSLKRGRDWSSIRSSAASFSSFSSSEELRDGGEHARRMMWESTLALAQGVLRGDRTQLSRAITLVESRREDHRRQAELLLEHVIFEGGLREEERDHGVSAAETPVAARGMGEGGEQEKAKAGEQHDRQDGGGGIRIGIAGPPGAGKSTFIEGFGTLLTRELGLRVAVLTIDPSSSRTGGSILGDKTRMELLSRDERAFIRSSPASGVLGGLALYTNDVVTLCQAAGYDLVLVETVGLGQSEIQVEQTVDMLLLLLPPAAGDELQGVKKGITEVTDAVVVNKADGEHLRAASQTRADYERSLRVCKAKYAFWQPPVMLCSSLHKTGLREVWEQVLAFKRVMLETGTLPQRRKSQGEFWIMQQMQAMVAEELLSSSSLRRMAGVVGGGRLCHRTAARALLAEWKRGAPQLRGGG